MSENTSKMLTYAIFNKPEAALDEIENDFLKLHKKEFIEYKKTYASLIRMNTKKSKLKNGMYIHIYQEYCRRVHIHSVINGIKMGNEAAERYNRVIFAFGWYKEHIDFFHQQQLSQIYREYLINIEMKIDYPWFFNIFKAIRSGELKGKEFDLWTGYRELEVEPDCKVQLSILMSEKSQAYNQIMKLHNKRRRSIFEDEALEKYVALYNDIVVHIQLLQESREWQLKETCLLRSSGVMNGD